jgi:polygalacturonase
MTHPFMTTLRIVLLSTVCLLLRAQPGAPVFNVKDYGATGKKADDALPAIQKAIETCARAGGGTVYLPAGQYTSGQIRLRSHVRLYIDSGATLFASLDSRAFEKDKAALIYGEDLENITIEGRGTVDGQATYEWRTLNDFDDAYIRENTLLTKAAGRPLFRSFPGGFPKETVYPRLILLMRCKDVRIAGLSFIKSRSWTINPYACERLVIDGVYIYSSLKEAVWADGIDPDGCKDVRIANSTIETGDDAIVFYSSPAWGPALPCENITVTNCRLSSASSAIKFCDGNSNAIRKVTIDNTVITSSNRGIAFMVFDGGVVSDVVLSNLTIECVRNDWFWWGDGDPIHFNIKRRSEVDGTPRQNEPKAGVIRDVIIRNVIARGQGTSGINGHPDSWLENVSLENVKLWISHAPESPLEKAQHAMKVRWAKNLKIKDVEVNWDKPESAKWESALYVQDVKGFELEGFSGRQAKLGADMPAVVLDQADDVIIRNSKAPEGTQVFVRVIGDKSRGIYLLGNDMLRAKVPFRADSGATAGEVKLVNNLVR